MGGDAFAGIGKAANRGEGSLRQRQASGKVSGRGEVRNEPVAQPAKFFGGVKYLAVQCHRRGAGGPGRVPLQGCTPVDQLCLGNGEIHLSGVGDGPYPSKGCLYGSAVGAVRRGRNSKGKIINIRKNKAPLKRDV